jgi:hypothetical protein
MRLLLMLLALPAMISCATAEITAFRDPAMSGVSYSDVAVFFPSRNLELRSYVEYGIARTLSDHKIGSERTVQLVAPTEEPTPAVFAERLRKEAFDALLIVTDTASTASTSSPPSSPWTSGKDLYFTAGHIEIDRRVNVSIVDLRLGKVVWVGTVTGLEHGREGPLFELGRIVTRKLLADRVISPGKTPAAPPPQKVPPPVVERRDISSP